MKSSNTGTFRCCCIYNKDIPFLAKTLFFYTPEVAY